MSFYLANILDHEALISLLEKDTLVIVRVGEASNSICQKLDWSLSQIGRAASKYVTIAAYETKDLCTDIPGCCLGPDKPTASICFFYHAKPVPLYFSSRVPVYSTERFYKKDDLLSLIVLIKQSLYRQTEKVLLPFGE